MNGLSDGVTRQRRSVAYGHKGMGVYSPNVPFEGGMARWPWEVGMPISSSSSGNNKDDIP